MRRLQRTLYRVWIAEYAGAPYQEVAAKARTHLEGLADLYATAAREAELIVIFKEGRLLGNGLACGPAC
jgi:thiaminase/transcriptional activator TenA